MARETLPVALDLMFGISTGLPHRLGIALGISPWRAELCS